MYRLRVGQYGEKLWPRSWNAFHHTLLSIYSNLTIIHILYKYTVNKHLQVILISIFFSTQLRALWWYSDFQFTLRLVHEFLCH